MAINELGILTENTSSISYLAIGRNLIMAALGAKLARTVDAFDGGHLVELSMTRIAGRRCRGHHSTLLRVADNGNWC